MARPKKYPEELIQRAIRLALESERPIAHTAADLGMHPETLRKKVRQLAPSHRPTSQGQARMSAQSLVDALYQRSPASSFVVREIGCRVL
jgi:transposase-like protein